MIYFCRAKLAVFIFLFGLCVVIQAAHIPVASVTESSGVAPFYSWDNLINDSGMSGDTHTTADTCSRGDYGDGMGLSNNYPVCNLVFDLGENRQIDDMWVWNYSDHGPTTVFGMKDVQIYIQAEGGPEVAAGYITIGQHDGTATNAVDYILDLEGATARYVKFYSAPFGNHNWSLTQYNYIGLGEVRFYDVNPDSDPNPDYNVPDLRFENFGYYEADSAAYGHYMDKVVIPSDGTKLYEFTNILHFNTHPVYGQADPRRAIQDAANLGYKVIMYPGVFGLHNEAEWQSLCTQVKAYYAGYEDYMYAISLVDEPDGQGWPIEKSELLIDIARNTFNDDVPITMMINGPQIYHLTPRNMDIMLAEFKINAYEMTTRAQYDAEMASFLSACRTQCPGLPIFILGWCAEGDDRLFPTLEQQGWYYETAINNPDIIGLMFYMLGSHASVNFLGTISSPESLSFHKQWSQTVVGQTVNIRFEDDFDQYNTQQELEAVYSGVAPTLNATYDHGFNGGKSAKFGPGSQNATHRVFVNDMPGVAEAFLRDNTITGSGHFGFKVINNAGDYVAVYGGGSSANYLVRDTANSVDAFNTGSPSLWKWQKAGFVFDGNGVAVYVDSELVYEATGGWAGGFSSIGGFYELAGDPGWGYIDNIKVSSRTIKVSASSQDSNHPATNTVNGSGITMDGQDSNSANMWLTSDIVTAPLHWIKFAFDKAYPITDMRIWNYNEDGFYTKGMKEVTIKYSTDDKNWTAVYVGQIPCADGTENRGADLTVNFAGAEAKYVAITPSKDANENWSGGLYNETGLSEVYFKFGEPATCFEANIEGYGFEYDINGDCSVDYLDMGILADNWLQCLVPGGPGCNYVNFEDAAALASDWFNCIDPENPDCSQPWMP